MPCIHPNAGLPPMMARLSSHAPIMSNTGADGSKKEKACAYSRVVPMGWRKTRSLKAITFQPAFAGFLLIRRRNRVNSAWSNLTLSCSRSSASSIGARPPVRKCSQNARAVHALRNDSTSDLFATREDAERDRKQNGKRNPNATCPLAYAQYCASPYTKGPTSDSGLSLMFLMY
jgi:hypothetical protein